MAGAPRRPLVAGNWKMNGLSGSETELARIIQGARELAALVELMVCPPATLLARFAAAARGTALRIGAQDCHAEPAGAFTGDLSAEMLKDAGASAVIVGHSERRIYHKETDADVRAKALAAWRAGLCAIVCVGESRTERENGRALAVVGTQVDGSVPDGATAAEPCRCLRAGLGHRDRADPDPRRCRRDARAYPAATGIAIGSAGAGRPNPLRRIGEAIERQGVDERLRMSTARWSAVRASRPTSSWRSRGFTARFAIADFHNNKLKTTILGGRHEDDPSAHRREAICACAIHGRRRPRGRDQGLGFECPEDGAGRTGPAVREGDRAQALVHLQRGCAAQGRDREGRSVRCRDPQHAHHRRPRQAGQTGGCDARRHCALGRGPCRQARRAEDPTSARPKLSSARCSMPNRFVMSSKARRESISRDCSSASVSPTS